MGLAQAACPATASRPQPLAASAAQRPAANELDVAYSAIPEAERDTWYERADQALAATGMPGWLRITPTVRAAAVRLWLGLEPVNLASG